MEASPLDLPADWLAWPSSPAPGSVRAARAYAGLSQGEAARLVHVTSRTWQKWESGYSAMHPALWHFFCIRAAQLAGNG